MRTSSLSNPKICSVLYSGQWTVDNFVSGGVCFVEVFMFSPGAKEAGAAGFFKGLGKGVVGVLARPAGGIVDFASSTLEGIKG